MRRFQKFLRYTSVSTSCLILDSIFCKNTLVRAIRKKSSNRSEICNLYSLAIILTKFHRFFNAPFVTIFSLILLEHPVLLLLYSCMQNLPNRSLSSHILFVVFVVVQGSQKTRVGKFGLVSKTLSIGIKSQVFDFGWCSSKAKKKIRYAQALCVALKLQGCWGKCSSMNFGCSTMQFEATQQRSLSLRPWQEAQLAYGVLPPLLPEFNAVEKTFNTG